VDAVKGSNEKGWQGGSSGDDKVWSVAVHPTSGDGQCYCWCNATCTTHSQYCCFSAPAALSAVTSAVASMTAASSVIQALLELY
jgi:hypothetical protein